jgi:hypothetical protein
MPPIVSAWSAALGAPAGLALAREARHLLAWSPRRLALFNHAGRIQAEHRPDSPLVAAAAADDGSAFACADEADRVTWFAPDLTATWQTVLAHRPAALALDPLGQYLAVADRKGGLLVFDRKGRRAVTLTCVRPVQFLAFAAELPRLVGAADFGLVTAVEPFGRGWLWQDRPVTHCAGLAVGGGGEPVAVACFSEGVRRYDANGRPLTLPGPNGPCQSVALSYDGKLTVTADLAGRLHGRDPAGGEWFAHVSGQPVTALALAALGERAYAALADGTVLALDLPPPGA